MDTQGSGLREDVSTKQHRIAENARKYPVASFTSLAHHINMDWLNTAYKRTRKDGAVGIDKVTAEEYSQGLLARLKSLKERAKSGEYWAPPVRRVNIPKPGSHETRPIGIPTFEDKVLQRAVTMLLEPIYEQDFKEFSFGFRPGRSQHGALRYLWEGMRRNQGGWVIDLDIRKFFDTLDHERLREILAKRVSDGVVSRLIGKWLKAGVMEKGTISFNERGTPQGGVISPLLSNIYLHEVMDTWFDREVRPRMKGKCFLVRFADDAVLGFELKGDAEKVMEVLPKRFEKFGLTIHPDKTKLLDMRRPVADDGRNAQGTSPGTFTFLGFLYYWERSHKGYWVLKNKTDKKRLSRALTNMKKWIKENRHEPMETQIQAINAKVRGHYAYYGITGNFRSIKAFYFMIRALWYKWLNRRSRNRDLYPSEYAKLLERYPLEPPKIVHNMTA